MQMPENTASPVDDKPSDIFQGSIIDCMNSIGYQVSESGVCFGLSAMVEQALLVGELQKHLKRIDDIRQHKSTFTEYFEALPIGSEARNDILAFFDGITLYQYTQRNPMDKAQLGRVTQKDRPAQALITPARMDEENKTIINTPLTTVTYNIGKVKMLLELIIKHYGTEPFALSVGSQNHAISVLYDPRPTPPILMHFDPNFMPSTVTTNADLYLIAALIGVSLKEPAIDNPLVAITIRTTEDTKAAQFQAELRNDTEWKKLCQIDRSDVTETRLLFAYREQDYNTCNEIFNYLSKQGDKVDEVLWSNKVLFNYRFKQGLSLNEVKQFMDNTPMGHVQSLVVEQLHALMIRTKQCLPLFGDILGKIFQSRKAEGPEQIIELLKSCNDIEKKIQAEEKKEEESINTVRAIISDFREKAKHRFSVGMNTKANRIELALNTLLALPYNERPFIEDERHPAAIDLRKALGSRRILSGLEKIHHCFDAKAFKTFKTKLKDHNDLESKQDNSKPQM